MGSEVGGETVTRRAVGGIMSEGMLCDSPMLGWSGGAAGVAVLIPATFNPGDSPPSSRPRGDGGGEAAAAADVPPVTDSMYEKKMTKEERKAAAKAAREAKKLAKKGEKKSEGKAKPDGTAAAEE